MELDPRVVRALIMRERLALVGRLIKGVVHNISGGLQMLRLPLDLLELRLAQGKDPELGSKLSALQQGVARISKEVEMLSAKGSQQQYDQPGPFSLSRLAAEQMEFWQGDMFFKHEAALAQELPQAALTVRAAYADVALAFNALLANALEALKACGRQHLTVTYREGEGRVWLEVRDDGPGPRPEMVPRLFQPFCTDKGAGHDGLGLFLARQALLPWGGEVSWSPQSPQTFLLAMPAH